MSSDKIKQLLKLIKKYDKSYYDDNVSLVSDEEYDKLKREYNFLVDTNDTRLDLFAGVAAKSVGYAPNQRFKVFKHQVPMLSLDNVTNEDEFLNYLKKIKRFFNLKEDEKIAFTCELKIDGLSFSARYEKGKLVHVLTRGDGVEGEDVTANVKQIDSFPSEIDLQDDVFEVRGEIYFSKQDFFNLNDKLHEKEKFSNPRNAASGTLRNLDTSLAKERNLKYFAYTFGQIDKKNLNIDSQFGFLQFIKKLKFNVAEDVICTNNLPDIQNYYNKILENRYKIPFDIDGIVVKIDNLDLQDRMGSTNHSQRWAIAYKFPAQEVKTKIIDVLHQVGRTGTLTPVAILEPVNAGGVLIKKATMHNYDDVEKKNLSVGSLVYIKRAGDVIPYIIKNCNNELDAEELACLKKVNIPLKCPSCFQDILVDQKSAVTVAKCVNKFTCPEQIVQSFFHFASRDAMNIKGLGEKIILRFFELGFLKKFSDLWNLGVFKDQIVSLDGFGEKSYNLLINSILEKTEISFSKFLFSLGVDGVGQVNAMKIAQFFGDIKIFSGYIVENFLNFGKELEKIDGIGQEVISSCLEYFSKIENLQEFQKLTEILKIKSETIEENLPFFGKSIVFTGQISISRQEAKSLAQKKGFKVLSSVSKSVDFLVAGEDAGFKLKAAQGFGIKILSENEWLNLLNGERAD